MFIHEPWYITCFFSVFSVIHLVIYRSVNTKSVSYNVRQSKVLLTLQNIVLHAPRQNIVLHAPRQNIVLHTPRQNIVLHAPRQIHINRIVRQVGRYESCN